MGKRIFLTISVLLLSVIIFGGCAYDYSKLPVKAGEFVPSEIEAILVDFLVAHPNRSSFSREERAAAEYLEDKLQSIGAETELDEFRHSYVYDSRPHMTGQTIEHTFTSQNVIGLIKGKNNESNKKIVIGSMYDNLYSYADYYEAYYYVNGIDYNAQSHAMEAEGALSATGAAASLMLAEKLAWYNDNFGLPYDVEIVFFGAEEFGCLGSKTYASSPRKNDALLFVNMYRLGGDNIYSYFDEVETAYGNLFESSAERLGYGETVSQPSGNQTIIAGTSTGKLPYTHFSLLGASAAFFAEGVKVANYTTGVWDSLLLTDRESRHYSNIMETPNDTQDNLASLCPHYNVQCGIVADTVYAALTDDSLLPALAEGSYDYGWLTYPIAGYIAVVTLCLVSAGVLAFLVKFFEKKYPPSGDGKKRVKVAVFGMGYENPKDADVFIDTRYSNAKHKSQFDPFDGDNPGTE